MSEQAESKIVAGDINEDQVWQFMDNLTLLQLSDFIAKFEDRYNVTAAAPMAMAAMPGAGDAAPAEEEKTEFDAILTEVGDSRINVIKEVRAITALGLKEAKAVVEGVPQAVKEGVSKEEAEEIKKKLEGVGAKVEIK